MEHIREWHVVVYLHEQENQTSARAVLPSGDSEISGQGVARRMPSDRNVPEIADELATARALSDLAHRLFDTTMADIEYETHHADASISGSASRTAQLRNRVPR
jgi:hypothetical protein